MMISIFLTLLLSMGPLEAKSDDRVERSDFQLAQNSIQSIDGIWVGEPALNYAFPFPYKEYAYQIWDVSQPSLIVTHVIGQQSENTKYELKVQGRQLTLISRGRSQATYEIQNLTDNEMILCDPSACRKFERRAEMPSLPSGYHPTPDANHVFWEWRINGLTQSSKVMELPLFSPSYSGVGVNGYSFVYKAESGHMYHVIVMNYLLGIQPEQLASYGFNIFLMVVDGQTEQTSLLGGTLSAPAFLNLNEDFVIDAKHDKDHVQFQLRIERVRK